MFSARVRAMAGSSCSLVRRAWARRGCPRSPWRIVASPACGESPTSFPRRRMRPLQQCCASFFATSPAGSPRQNRLVNTLAPSCPSSDRQPAAPIARPWSRPCVTRSRRSRRVPRRSSSSTTSNGQTRQLLSCCRRLPKPQRSGRWLCSAPTGARRSRVATRCGDYASTSAARDGWPNSALSRSTMKRRVGWRHGFSKASRGPRFAPRCTTAPKGCRSSWRSWRVH